MVHLLEGIMKKCVACLLLLYSIVQGGEDTSYKKEKAQFFRDGTIHEFPYKDESPRLFTLSYRGSGSHYFMYLVQYFSRRVWQVPHKRYFFHLPRLDLTLSPYYRCHEVTARHFFNERNGFFFPYNAQKDKLILLLRNYKESCCKTPFYKRHRKAGNLPGLESNCVKYYQNIKCFDRWNPENRFLVRYEDLLERTEETLREVLAFLEVPVDEAKMRAFFAPQNLKKHQERCLYLTRVLNGSSTVSRGSGIHYHSSLAAEGILDAIDRIFERYSPGLFHRYLEGYKD